MSRLTNFMGAPVAANLNLRTAGARGPALLQDIWLLDKRAHLDREVIPELRMNAKGSGACDRFYGAREARAPRMDVHATSIRAKSGVGAAA